MANPAMKRNMRASTKLNSVVRKMGLEPTPLSSGQLSYLRYSDKLPSSESHSPAYVLETLTSYPLANLLSRVHLRSRVLRANMLKQLSQPLPVVAGPRVELGTTGNEPIEMPFLYPTAT